MLKKIFLNNTSKSVRLPAIFLKIMGVDEYVEMNFDGKNIIISKPVEKSKKED
jgi:virulence-associated protein VagC